MKETTQRLGAPEILVCNAGITRDGLVLRMSDEAFGAVIDANLTGAFRVANRPCGQWCERAGAHRVHLVGIGYRRAGRPGQLRGVQGGLIGLARSMAKEIASRK